MSDVFISVVIPVYAGEACLEELAGALEEVRAELDANRCPARLGEAVFVDDGSVDQSASVLRRLRESREWIHVVTLSRNFGQHPATIAGILYTSGDWVATIDEDLQHPPRDIPRLLRHAILNDLDIVYARADDPVHQSAVRDFGSRWTKWIVARLTGNRFVPLFNSFRMMRGSVARAAAAVCANDPYFDVAACWFTTRIGSLALELKDRRFIEGRGSGYTFRSLVRHAGRMLSSSELKFLRFGAALGLLALGGSLLISLVVLAIKIVRPEAIEARGWVSLVLLISFFGGLISLLAGVLLELVTALIIRAKGKPAFFTVDRSSDLTLLGWAKTP